MDKLPETVVINSPRTEAARLRFTRKVIEQGFYKKHGFIVVPHLIPHLDPNPQVIYPRSFMYKKVDTEGFTDAWALVENQYWSEVRRYFPEIVDGVTHIEVRITRYGTVSSNARMSIRSGRREIFYLREDMGIEHLAAMMLNSILHTEKKGLGITWTKREALMDFIMTRPVMKKLFPNFRPMMAELSRVPAKIRRESERYVHELGFKIIHADLEVVDGKVVLLGKQLGHEMTKLEKRVMKLMIERMGELASYDEIADVVWGPGEFKTFWAINKLVERMRPKLTNLGIDGSRLRSVRGQGYILQ